MPLQQNYKALLVCFCIAFAIVRYLWRRLQRAKQRRAHVKERLREIQNS